MLEPSSTPTLSWPAVLAGAVACLAGTILSFAVIAGLDLASLSSAHPTTNGIITVSVIALVLAQWFSAGLGGYLAGRLRGRWIGTHEHEVFFRDTAHGFLAWATATVALTFALGLTAPSRDALRAPGWHLLHLPSAQPESAALLRTDSPLEPARAMAVRNEIERRLAEDVEHGEVSSEERAYLTGLVSAAAGVPAGAAAARVDLAAEHLATASRRHAEAATVGSLLLALSLTVGAFVACISAALGGKRRDVHA